jgi:hypothetical protein
VGLTAIFYCLRYETSLSVASYDSQGYGRSIRHRLHKRFSLSKSQSQIATDGQSISKSWCQNPSGAHDQIFIIVLQLSLVLVGRLLRRGDGSVFCICCWPLSPQSFLGASPLGLEIIFHTLRFETFLSAASLFHSVIFTALIIFRSTA